MRSQGETPVRSLLLHVKLKIIKITCVVKIKCKLIYLTMCVIFFYTVDKIEIKNQESEKQRGKMRIKMAINLQLKWSLQFVVNWCVFKLCKDHNRKSCFCVLLQMRFKQRIEKNIQWLSTQLNLEINWI